MKKIVRNCLGLASMMALPLMFTSCGEFDNPLENMPSSTVPTTYSVDVTTATGDITIESDGAVISGEPDGEKTVTISAGVHEVTFSDIKDDSYLGPAVKIVCNGDVTLNLKNENSICEINTNDHTVTINASDATNTLYVSGALSPITGHGTIKIEGGKLTATSQGSYNAIECNVIVTGGVLRAVAEGTGSSIDGDLTVSGSGAVYIGGTIGSGKAVSGTVTGAYVYDGTSWSAETLNGTSTDKHSVSTDNSAAPTSTGNWAL